MNSFGIDKSWIEAGLDIDLIQSVMSIIEEKRKNVKCRNLRVFGVYTLTNNWCMGKLIVEVIL